MPGVKLSLIKAIALEVYEPRPDTCQYEDCSRPFHSRALCKHHYSYYYKYLNKDLPKWRTKPSGEPDPAAFVGDPCSMCGEPSTTMGYCDKHYSRYNTQQRRAAKKELQNYNRV